MDSNMKITAKDCLYLANDIIVDRNLLIPRLTSIKDINYSLFAMIFEDIFVIDFSQFESFDPKSKAQEIQLMDRLLKVFSEDLFCMSLDHIKAVDIVERKLDSIHDLLEIISTFVKFIPKKFSKRTSNRSLGLKSTFDTKSVQTNGLINDLKTKERKTEDLFRRFDELKFRKQLELESTSSSPSSQSIASIQSFGSLRQMNSCGDFDKSNRKQDLVKPSKQSKAIQTEMQFPLSPKSDVLPKEKTFDEYKRLKCENFATLLGHRLHETLKLKEMTDIIELKIKRYYGDVSAQTPQRRASKSPTKLKSTRKQPFRVKKSPQTRRTTNQSKPKSNLKQSFRTSSLDDLIKTYPEISRNTIKSLKDQENRQKKVIENLNKDIWVKELKVKSRLNDAIETQQKRSKLIRNEIRHLEALADSQGSKMEKIKENAAKRDSRIEKARMHKVLEKYENDLSSKYKKLQSIEENIVLKEFDKRQKQQKDYINAFRDRIKENHSLEVERQRNVLTAFETLYQNKYEMLTQNLTEEEKRLKAQISDQSYYLRSMKRQLNARFETDFRSIFDN